MSNPFSGFLTTAYKKLFRQAVEAMLADNGMTVPCKIYYTGTKAECDNCVINLATGKSSGVYKTGGPLTFTNGLCPRCGGDGVVITRLDETIYCCVSFNYREWTNLGFSVQNPDGMCLTLSTLTTLPKIKNAEEIVINTGVEGYVRHKFVRQGEPNNIGCCLTDDDSAFIATLWKRVG